jgi:hypothetical protein
MYPVPSDTGIDTPYGQAGNSWGCGWHDGVDFAVPVGRDVVAVWHGTVLEAAYPTSFGSAFGRAAVIDHDHLPDGSAGGWAIYAHLSELHVQPGQRVAPGQVIGRSGDTGNVTGPHHHFGVYMNPYWSSGGGVQPQPWLDAGGGAAPTGWVQPAGTPVYAKYLTWNGQNHNSDGVSTSIACWQEMLNRHPLTDGVNLPVTGAWHEMTAAETQKCQAQHIPPADEPLQAVYVGPQQFEHVRAQTGAPYVWAG